MLRGGYTDHEKTIVEKSAQTQEELRCSKMNFERGGNPHNARLYVSLFERGPMGSS